LWDWLFESTSSPLHNKSPSRLSGFTNATTRERVRYDEVKAYATYLSTALVHKLGLSAGETVALFSPNSIWYPVAMFATNRFGEFFSPKISFFYAN
jgi:acyl-CoA synthetase (AMP-forming)/AMP-acid ligase II